MRTARVLWERDDHYQNQTEFLDEMNSIEQAIQRGRNRRTAQLC